MLLIQQPTISTTMHANHQLIITARQQSNINRLLQTRHESNTQQLPQNPSRRRQIRTATQTTSSLSQRARPLNKTLFLANNTLTARPLSRRQIIHRNNQNISRIIRRLMMTEDQRIRTLTGLNLFNTNRQPPILLRLRGNYKTLIRHHFQATRKIKRTTRSELGSRHYRSPTQMQSSAQEKLVKSTAIE